MAGKKISFIQRISSLARFRFIKRSGNPIWIIGSFVLGAIFIFLVLYSFRILPNSGGSILFQTSQQQNAATSQEQVFSLPVTVVLNLDSTEQKTKMDSFLENLADPQRALKSTVLQTKWLDYRTDEAQKLLNSAGVKYLPQIFLDSSVEKHPQFAQLSSYLNKHDDFYFIRLNAIQFLEYPSPDGGHILGADHNKAPVVIVGYESFTCPDCATMEKVLKQALKDFPGKISISLKQLEPGLLDNLLAQGAECAGEQNKYFQMHDRLFEQQNNLLPIIQDTSSTTNSEKAIRDFLAKQASSLGLKIKDFQSCLDKKTYEIMIQNQTLDALDYGLGQLPSFFINHQFVNGALPYSDFKSMIEKEIKI